MVAVQKKEFITQKSERLDKFLTQQMQESRNQIERLIKKGYVQIDQKKVTKPGYKLKPKQNVILYLPKTPKSTRAALDFDVRSVYEDEDILVLDKPPGVVVHPAPSVKDATLVDWLKQKGVSLSTISGEERHGIVHRIDKETSGLLVVAKNNEAHRKLSEQLQDKSMGRYYLAFIEPPLTESVIVDKPIGRNPKNRLKMAIVEDGRASKSAFAKLVLSKNGQYELIGAKLFSGRTHQIRVHLHSLHRHILGDGLYGFKSKSVTIPRVFLHAYILYLFHPRSGKRMEFRASLPQDMKDFASRYFDMEILHETIDPRSFTSHFDDAERLWSTATAFQTKSRS